jgi:Secretion system C-terminal sorting domain
MLTIHLQKIMGMFCVFAFVLLSTTMPCAAWSPLGGSLNYDPNESSNSPSIDVEGETPYVAWKEDCNGNANVFVKRYTNAWTSLGGSLNVDTNYHTEGPVIAVAGSTPYVAWNEYNGSYMLLHVKLYNGSSWETKGSVLNNSSTQHATYPAITIYNGTPYVAWHEASGGTYRKIFVKHYNGTDWQLDGSSFSVNASVHAYYPELAFVNGTPYVAFVHYGADRQVYVYRFNGTDWSQYGSCINNNTDNDAGAIDIVGNNGTPYIIWSEDNDGTDSTMGTDPFRARVKYHNGTDWEQLGDVLNIDVNKPAGACQLAFYGTTPYVSWGENIDPGNMGMETNLTQLHVKYYNGSTWVEDNGIFNMDANHTARAGGLTITDTGAYITWAEDDGASRNDIFVKSQALVAPGATATVTPTCTAQTTATSTPVPSSGPSGLGLGAVYPNPAQDQVWFNLSQTSATQARVEVYNSSGERVGTVAGEISPEGRIGWNVKDMAPGIYMYQVILVKEGKEEKLEIQKVCVVK